MRLIDAERFRRELDMYYPFTKAEQCKHNMADIAKGVVLDILMKQPVFSIASSQWTPCDDSTKEGYPTQNGWYLITEANFGGEKDAEYKQIVSHPSYFKDGKFEDRIRDNDHSNITAWMKMPEPYIEEKND